MIQIMSDQNTSLSDIFSDHLKGTIEYVEIGWFVA